MSTISGARLVRKLAIDADVVELLVTAEIDSPGELRSATDEDLEDAGLTEQQISALAGVRGQ